MVTAPYILGRSQPQRGGSLMARISESLRREAADAYFAYESLFIERLLRRPGGNQLQGVLDSGDAGRVRAFIDDMRRKHLEFLNGWVGPLLAS